MIRRAILVRGIIQGVGFRPFVYQLAHQLYLAGFVRNRTGDVLIEVEGPLAQLDQFLYLLATSCPPLAHIDEISWEQRSPLGETSFQILRSEDEDQGQILISPDVATCDECLQELFDPADRRYLYPFLNCTHCGPRLTIIRGAPYDRERTTMADFSLCPACRAEYEDPTDRRFHAQPIACPSCGPKLEFWDAQGNVIPANDPLDAALLELRLGKILAIKGLGGFHLACDATNETSVDELRRRKLRYEYPLAVLVRDLEASETLCEITSTEKHLLRSPARPIVLVRKRPEFNLAGSVAPGNPTLGVMLPYTPLHELLMRRLDTPLVMTSGNRSDEPIAYRDEAVLEGLTDIADFYLTNNRPIHIRCDDSVTRVVCEKGSLIRRSRGNAPAPLSLPFECPCPILALGGQQKNTFALGVGRQALLSHHLGDLDHYEAYRAYCEAVRHYENLFDIRSEIVVRDLHPDYMTTHYSRERESDAKILAVQHHHAHLASCMAEHGLTEPVIGVIFDGTGFGTDGTIWGGEFLVGDYQSFRRAAHLRPVPMPSGEKAIREPWRMALGHVLDGDEDQQWFEQRVALASIGPLVQMTTRGLNSPLTSSVGRLFDAVAALAGGRQKVSYEGQAAIELEWHALEAEGENRYPFALNQTTTVVGGTSPIAARGVGVSETTDLITLPPLHIDTRPIIRAVIQDAKRNVPLGVIARRFHFTLVAMILQTCELLRKQTQLNKVACSGGVFLNALLTERAHQQLERRGFEVFLHERVPASDGGLSLGQLAIAASS